MARVIFPNGVYVDCAVSEVAGVVASGGQAAAGDKLHEAVHSGRMDRDDLQRRIAEKHAEAVLELRALYLENDWIYQCVRRAVREGRDHFGIYPDCCSSEAVVEAVHGIPGFTASATRVGFTREVVVRWR